MIHKSKHISDFSWPYNYCLWHNCSLAKSFCIYWIESFIENWTKYNLEIFQSYAYYQQPVVCVPFDNEHLVNSD
jgi:hypothetical protein